jgi:alpha-glucosidase
MTLHAGRSVLTIQVLADDLLRVRFRTSPALSSPRSWAVVRSTWPPGKVTTSERADTILISTSSVTLSIARNPLRLSFRDAAGRVINEDDPGKGMSWSGSEVRVWKVMPADERYFGFGEKAGTLERRDLHMTMWNSDIPAYAAQTDPLYQSIPFFYGIRKGNAYGIFLDNTWRSSFDMGKEARDQYSFGAENGELDYYFFAGPSPAAVLERFTELVGRMPLPPRWALGYQQSRWSYTPATRVLEIARGFRTRSIPCDVIYLDIDYMDGYRIFTWHPTSFRNPPALISELKGLGFTTAVIVDPGIKVDTTYAAYRSGMAGGHFLRYPDGTLYTGKVWPGVCAFPDFTSRDARRWWGDQLSTLTGVGVRGLWNDMNEPSVFDVPTHSIDLTVIHDDEGSHTPHAKNHNIYGMQMTRATYEGALRLVPSERPFVLTRASFAGGWRYAASWTGDNVSSWEHLRMALTMCLNLSIAGQPFVGADIGGFIGSPSGELFARWLQLGVCTPLMRGHAEIHSPNKEPWEYGDRFTDINRETINLRYRLLPYIYTVMEAASRTGLPAMRPMVFAFPEEERLAENGDQFLFGDDLLVAPVLIAGDTTRRVELPRGRWYDFWSGNGFEGGTSVTVPAPLDRLPLLVRAGATVPMQQVVQSTGAASINPLTLRVYPAEPGTSRTSGYYEDDGLSFSYREGAFLRRKFTSRNLPDEAVLSISTAEGAFTPSRRGVVTHFVDFGAGPPSGVTLNGVTVPRSIPGLRSPGGIGWDYDRTTRTVVVRALEIPGEMVIVARR